MIDKIRETKKEKKERIITGFISIVVMAVILVIINIENKIYPFGNKSISYYDMGQLYTSMYYHTYDVLHGEQNIFWNCYSAGGITMSDTMGNYILQPFNLFWVLVNRNQILLSLSIFLMIKVCFASMAMTIFMGEKYANLSKSWRIVSGIIYASSGYILQYYTNIQFLDMVAIFPLLIMGVEQIITKNKNKLYIIMLFFTFLNHIQIVAMVVFFVIIYSYLGIYGLEKHCKKMLIVKLGISSFISAMISCPIWITQLFVILQSSRAKDKGQIFKNLINDLNNQYYLEEKTFMLYGCEFVIALLIITLIDYKKTEFRQTRRGLFLCIIMVMPILSEWVNTAWHIGGYVCFPMRFGFMLTFSLLLLMGRIVELEHASPDQEKTEEKKQNIVVRLLSIILVASNLYVIYYYLKIFSEYGIQDINNFNNYYIVLIITVLVFIYLLAVKEKKIFIQILIVGQCFLGWNGLLAPEKDMYPEQDSTYIEKSLELEEPLKIANGNEDGRIARVRDDSLSLNVNYPFIIQNSSMANWTYGVNANLKELMVKLGYSQNYNRILESGATLFTDAFWHIRNIISFKEEAGEYQKLAQQVNDYYIYKNELVYPYGVLVNEKDIEGKDEVYDPYQYQNDLFYMVSGEKGLFETFVTGTVKKETKTLKDGCEYYFEIPIKEKKQLYLKAGSKGNIQIYVNNEQLVIPTIGDRDNTSYPALFNNGLLDIGLYENEVVSVKITSEQPINLNQVSFAGLNIDLLEKSIVTQESISREIKVKKNGLEVTLNNPGYKYLLLPLGYTKGFTAKRNNEKIKVESSVNNALTLVPLVEGENIISLTYIPEGLWIGIMLGICGVVMWIFNGHLIGLFANTKIMCNFSEKIFFLLFVGIIIYLYIVPILCDILIKILQLVGRQTEVIEFLEKIGGIS